MLNFSYFSDVLEGSRQLALNSHDAERCEDNVCGWAVHGTSVYCSVDALNRASLVGLYKISTPYDHLYKNVFLPSVVLHSTLGTRAFSQFHRYLSKSNRFRYIFRQVDALHCPDVDLHPTTLSGYGVMLHIKNMEYKALDDRNPHGSEEEEVSNDLDDENNDGEASELFLTL